MSGFFASRVLEPVSPHPGESGYFSSPGDSLDPHLFDGESVRPEVRGWILSTLVNFWTGKGYSAHGGGWWKVWIAGSGASYQWAAGRGNGDLDILIGVDWPKFFDANPQFAGLSDVDMADVFNAESHADLWPTTANQDINGQTYEVTWYVNPHSTDIRTIHPYAAYCLSDNTWTVRPPEGRAFHHPRQFFEAAERETQAATAVINRYNEAVSHPGPNSTYAALLASQEASQMYDDIHLGRKNAFADGGKGYGDYYNFRWQYHKNTGTVQTLHEVAQAQAESRDEYAERTYGGSIDAADVALRRAALWNRGGNGR